MAKEEQERVLTADELENEREKFEFIRQLKSDIARLSYQVEYINNKLEQIQGGKDDEEDI